MKRCAGCRWARYCSPECQREDWRSHKHICCPDHRLPTGDRFIQYHDSSSASSSSARDQISSILSANIPGGSSSCEDLASILEFAYQQSVQYGRMVHLRSSALGNMPSQGSKGDKA